MSEPRKKPGVAFWASVVVVVGLILYPLSFGPECWWRSRWPYLPFPEVRAVSRAYTPIGWAMRNAPKRVARVLRWYATLGFDGELLIIPSNWDGSQWTTVRP